MLWMIYAAAVALIGFLVFAFRYTYVGSGGFMIEFKLHPAYMEEDSVTPISEDCFFDQTVEDAVERGPEGAAPSWALDMGGVYHSKYNWISFPV